MYLSTVDRLVKKLGPVNALIEKLCERLLPNQVAHAAGTGQCECFVDWRCGQVSGSSYGYYCNYGPGTPYDFVGCYC